MYTQGYILKWSLISLYLNPDICIKPFPSLVVAKQFPIVLKLSLEAAKINQINNLIGYNRESGITLSQLVTTCLTML